MSELELQDSILKAVQQLSVSQQIKLLDFIRSLIGPAQEQSSPQRLLQFAGLFDQEDLKEIKKPLEKTGAGDNH